MATSALKPTSAQLAFELNALFFVANFALYLRHDAQAIERARKAVETRLDMLRPVS